MPTLRLSLVAAFGMLGAVLGLLAWRAAVRAAWIENALEDLGDSLSDKNSYLRLMNELQRDGGLDSEWTREDLVAAIRRWTDPGGRTMPPSPLVRSLLGLLSGRHRDTGIPLAELASVTGAVDLANLALAKGMERDLVVERPSRDGKPEYRHSVQFPSNGAPADRLHRHFD